MVINLDSSWSAAFDPDNSGRAAGWWQGPRAEARPMRVPWPLQAEFPGQHGVAWYWREVEAPLNPRPDGRWLLRFWAVDYLAEVWVNDHLIGSHEGGETPFVLDATHVWRPGASNRVAVRVVNPVNEPIDGLVLGQTPHRNKTVPHRTGGSYNYGGMLESVELLLVPPVWVEDLYARPQVEASVIQVQVSLRNASAETAGGVLAVTVAPAAGGEALHETRQSAQLMPGLTCLTEQVQIHGMRLWDLDDPYLYRVTARWEAAPPGSSDERSVRCGCRDFRVKDGYFRLNGRRLLVRSTHTGNHSPGGQVVAPPSAPDLLRRDLLYAKSCGYNMVRFIAGVGHPYQLDLCDEIGLMVYEESLAGWCLEDSAEMGRRFDFSTREMVQRDRNHPSVVIWGLLNETGDGPVFRHAVASLPLVRALDDARLVLLGSGRWDGQWHLGSVSNPGSSTWEHVWGAEAPAAPPCRDEGPAIPAYKPGGGDVQMYPSVPHSREVEDHLRTVGRGTRPVFVSEYGIGSLMNAVREVRCYEQSGLPPDLEDATLMRHMADSLTQDWQRWDFDQVYADVEDMLRDSQRLHARQRLLGFDLLRANPQICGYNLTGMLDHGMTGEGVWTFWREWKPGAFEALSDGWAPLRWCLFSRPLHQYVGRPLAIEAVLANEDVLAPGDYPCRYRLIGPAGVAWERRHWLHLPTAGAGGEPPLAVEAVRADVTIDGPPGSYQFAAVMERGGAPAGGRLNLRLSPPLARVKVGASVLTWGLAPPVVAWLAAHGIVSQPLAAAAATGREVILIGGAEEHRDDLEGWRGLMTRVAQGACAIFLEPGAFTRGADPVGWLPLTPKGQCNEVWDWLYHKECVAKRHPVFAELPSGGILDWDVYGPVIAKRQFSGQAVPDEVVAAAFALGYPCAGGYYSGIVLGAYRFLGGHFVLNTLRLLEHLDQHPAADRLLVNLLAWGAQRARRPAVRPRRDLLRHLAAVGLA